MSEQKNQRKILNRKVLEYGITAAVISAAVFITYFLVKDLGNITRYVLFILNEFISALTPLLIAIVLAYLFNKPVLFIERFFKKVKGKRTISIAFLYILIIGALASIVNFIVPRVQQSMIRLIYNDLPSYSDVISYNLQQSMEWFKSLNLSIDYSNIQNYVAKFSNISSVVLDNIMNFAKVLTQGIFNVILAMILAFYILNNKEKLLSSIKELIYLYGGNRIKNSIISEAREIDSVLSGYITGMLLDALNVSILVMIGLRIIGHNYYFLMGITIGILNLIPYFGSLVGSLIACLIALFQGVPKALYTLIILVIIQQFDGNVIQPRIVGDRVGLEPLWIITAVLLFGYFWSIPGMIIAVPFTALIKAILKRVIDRRRTKVEKSNSDSCI